MRLLLLVPIVLALPACTKKRSEIDEAMAAMVAFKDRMCSCKDKACADKVEADMKQWSSEQVKRTQKRIVPTEAELKHMQQVGTRYGECMAKLVGALKTPSASTAEVKLATGDQVIKHVYDTLDVYAVENLGLWYVRADGTIDPKYGHVEIDLAPPNPPDPRDDPDRPIGAPIPKAPPTDTTKLDDCPTVGWANGVLTRKMRPSCLRVRVPLARPKCSAVEIWKRAIADGVPAQGLAVLELKAKPTQHWKFSIEDEPRNIHVLKEIEDTCEPTLEKP